MVQIPGPAVVGRMIVVARHVVAGHAVTPRLVVRRPNRAGPGGNRAVDEADGQELGRRAASRSGALDPLATSAHGSALWAARGQASAGAHRSAARTNNRGVRPRSYSVKSRATEAWALACAGVTRAGVTRGSAEGGRQASNSRWSGADMMPGSGMTGPRAGAARNQEAAAAAYAGDRY